MMAFPVTKWFWVVGGFVDGVYNIMGVFDDEDKADEAAADAQEKFQYILDGEVTIDGFPANWLLEFGADKLQ